MGGLGGEYNWGCLIDRSFMQVYPTPANEGRTGPIASPPPIPPSYQNVALLNGVPSVNTPETTEINGISCNIPAYGQTFVPPAAPNNKLGSFSYY